MLVLCAAALALVCAAAARSCTAEAPALSSAGLPLLPHLSQTGMWPAGQASQPRVPWLHALQFSACSVGVGEKILARAGSLHFRPSPGPTHPLACSTNPVIRPQRGIFNSAIFTMERQHSHSLGRSAWHVLAHVAWLPPLPSPYPPRLCGSTGSYCRTLREAFLLRSASWLDTHSKSSLVQAECM